MKFFKENKWATWWDSLPKHTREYLESQPIWNDSDVIKFSIISLIIGFAIGSLFTFIMRYN